MCEMKDSVRLKYLCSAFSTTLSLKEIDKEIGKYPVYGAAGLMGFIDYYNSDCEYLGIIKDGAGVGRIEKYPGKSSLLGTMTAIIPNAGIEINWLKYAINSLDLGHPIDKTTIPHIYFSVYGNSEIRDICQEEQRRIADYLDTACSKVDALIANQQAQIEKLKAYKQSLITEVVTHGLEPDAPMKDSGVEWIGRIPAHWKVKRGKALFIETDARSVDGTEELLTVSQYTGITPRSQKNVNMFESLTLEGYKICEIGDIAANTMWLWAGAIGVSEYRGVISPSYNVYRQISENYIPSYLDNLLRAPMLVQEYASRSTGIRASRLRLYPKDFMNIMFPVPPIEEQKDIMRVLKEKFAKVDKLIDIKQAKIEKLEQYKKSLIYEYVTGKKEVT